VTETIAPTTLATNIENVRRRIADAAERAGRDPESVALVAVSKTVDRAAVDAAYAFGLRHFGENRVQDSVRKYAEPLPADAELHLIGQLQSNKARQAAALFSVIESVDRPSLIDALEREAERLGRRLPVLLQVNVAGEAQKAGCSPDDAAALAARLLAAPGFDLRGLMTIAPLVPDPEQVRPVFAGLRDLRDALREQTGAALSVLSMGMSDDFVVAISEGATHVRVGRAVFAG
jgi:pyridoxal phosphate enzyme (YggS family)